MINFRLKWDRKNLRLTLSLNRFCHFLFFCLIVVRFTHAFFEQSSYTFNMYEFILQRLTKTRINIFFKSILTIFCLVPAKINMSTKITLKINIWVASVKSSSYWKAL